MAVAHPMDNLVKSLKKTFWTSFLMSSPSTNVACFAKTLRNALSLQSLEKIVFHFLTPVSSFPLVKNYKNAQTARPPTQIVEWWNKMSFAAAMLKEVFLSRIL